MSDAATALTTVTAVGALATAMASWRAAIETRRGWQESQRSERLRTLQDIHALVGHVTEVGWSEKANIHTKIAISLGGGPMGVWFTIGQDLRGKIAAAGAQLPQCTKVADSLIAGTVRKEAPIREALDEVERAMKGLARAEKRKAFGALRGQR